MKKNFTFLLIISVITSISNAKDKYSQESMSRSNQSSINQNNKQQNFIAYNGMLGIYQEDKQTAYINKNSFSKIKKILKQSDKKIKKQWNSMFLGTLIDGNNEYELYGKNNNPEPDNKTGIRTQDALAYDFMSDFGSGKFTPNDLWD